MSSSNIDLRVSRIIDVKVTDDTLSVELEDGRTISVPLAWYPRLRYGAADERLSWHLIGGGEGIHWPALDEDVSLEDLILGRRSGESLSSLKQWREKHA
jgi:hypothetical protein